MAKAVALSTIDNGFDPFDSYEDWLRRDIELDHGCCAILDRLTYVSDAMSDEEKTSEYERAIDLFLLTDPEGIYIKVVKEIDDEPDYAED